MLGPQRVKNRAILFLRGLYIRAGALRKFHELRYKFIACKPHSQGFVPPQRLFTDYSYSQVPKVGPKGITLAILCHMESIQSDIILWKDLI